jgi:hypothetical protein
VIGQNWIQARDETGGRRLDNPEDFVRVEIASALVQGKRVIPVLVGEARMPRSDELPEAIKPLARRHAVRLTHERFRADMQGLVKALQDALEEADALRRAEDARGKAREAEECDRAATEEERRREADITRQKMDEQRRSSEARAVPGADLVWWISALGVVLVLIGFAWLVAITGRH